MSNKPRKMNKIRIVLRSVANGMSIKAISRSHSISRNTVKNYLKEINEKGLKVGEVLELEDEAIERLFYRVQGRGHLGSDLKGRENYYKEELSKPHVTIQLLHEEYEQNGGKLGRSRFYEELRKIQLSREVTYTKAESHAGKRLEVDYSGKKLKYLDAEGNQAEAEVLVCVLSKSKLIYCEAQSNQQGHNYIAGLGRALQYIGKLPQEIVSDNLKSGVKKSDRYEPTLTDLCEEASEYYGIHITATRVAKPRDKADVERSVRIVYERVYAKIRDRRISGLEELNRLISHELEELNNRKIKDKPSRREIFNKEEATLMKDLEVSELLEIRKSRTCKVGKNYHIELTEDRHYYSVPYVYVGEEVKMRYGQKDVEIYFRGKRIALHQREKGQCRYITIEEHMPPNHKAARAVEGYTKQDIIKQAGQIGESTQKVVEDIINRNKYEAQAFKSALGVIHLAKKYGVERLEKANEKLIYFHPNYSSIRDYLSKNIDQIPSIKIEEKVILHDNLRHLKVIK